MRVRKKRMIGLNKRTWRHDRNSTILLGTMDFFSTFTDFAPVQTYPLASRIMKDSLAAPATELPFLVISEPLYLESSKSFICPC